ncbi:MAG TPA: helix-turn-helix domain-containing protein [Acidimicrobiales bacterium]|nr:helix-turn-helix domain-containing protein [Acidimicrobiales bacterium]
MAPATSPGTALGGLSAQVDEVVRLVEGEPGISRAKVKIHLRGRGQRRELVINSAVNSGRVFLGPARFRARAGSQRSGLGLHPRPVAAARSQLAGQTLSAARKEAGLGAGTLARRLEVSRALIFAWEQGRQPVPIWAISRIESALAEGPPPDPAEKVLPRVVAAIEADPGLHKTALQARIGNGRAARRALEAALRDGTVHVREIRGSMSGGLGIRTTLGYFPGRAPDQLEVPSRRALRAAREYSGWTQTDAALRLGVSLATYRKWERGQRVPSWAIPALRRLVQDAHASPKPDGAAEAVPWVVESVAASPLVTVNGLARSGAFRKSVLEEAIRRARREGLIHGRQGLLPGPEQPPLEPGDIRQLRLVAGWTQAELAEQLGVTNAAVSGWESTHPPAERYRAQLRAVLEGAPNGVEVRKGRLFDRIASEPGLTRNELTRTDHGGAGRGALMAEALDALLDEGRAHLRLTLKVNARGVRRSLWGFHPGPAQDRDRVITGPELGQRRREAGLSRAQLGTLVGVSDTLVSRWEQASRVIPASWAPQLLQVLDQVGSADQEREDPLFQTDEDLEAELVALVVAEPGLSARQVTMRLRGDIRRRWAAVRRLEQAGRIHEEGVDFRDALGRQRRRLGLVAGPGPTSASAGPFSDAELESAALHLVATRPGILPGQLVQSLRGDMNRRWDTVKRLEATEQLRKGPVVIVDRLGRRRTWQGLFTTG